MSYGLFVGQLNKNIEGCIVAYDNKKEHGGCVLYLKRRPYTIFVPATIINQHWTDAIRVLQEKMRTLNCDEHHLTLVNNRGILTFEPAPPPKPTST